MLSKGWGRRNRARYDRGEIDSGLARTLQYASSTTVPMAQTHKHPSSLAGISSTKAVRFGCAVMRLVAICNWNKTASAGFKA
jgi:hypothetical protein